MDDGRHSGSSNGDGDGNKKQHLAVSCCLVLRLIRSFIQLRRQASEPASLAILLLLGCSLLAS